MSMSIVAPVTAASSPRLSEVEAALIQQMVEAWSARRRGNDRRQMVYDQKNLFTDLRISTPPELRNLEAVLGWGAKAVDVVSDRIQFERFVSVEGDDDPHGLNSLVAENDFQVEFSQAVTSALTHSCAFVSVAQGLDGEPDALWLTRSAQQATGIWDRRKRGLSAALTVEEQTDGQVSRLFAYFPDKTVELERVGSRFKMSVLPNLMGRVPVEVVRFKPDLKRPFGRSRITPAVEYFIYGGVRTLVRSEIGAEFFAAPQRYGLGVSEEAFDMDKWTAVTGRFLTLTRDEEGELPQVGQFQQHSMQPHSEHLRTWAAQMSGESSIPMNELGFFTDNPSSDAAIQSQRDPLRLIADGAITSFKSALRNLAITTVALRDGRDDVKVSPWFAPTFRLPDSAAADAALKQAQAIPWIAESSVFLEKLNYSPAEIERLLADKRQSRVSELVGKLRSGGAEPVSGETGGALDEAQVLKAKADE